MYVKPDRALSQSGSSRCGRLIESRGQSWQASLVAGRVEKDAGPEENARRNVETASNLTEENPVEPGPVQL